MRRSWSSAETGLLREQLGLEADGWLEHRVFVGIGRAGRCEGNEREKGRAEILWASGCEGEGVNFYKSRD